MEIFMEINDAARRSRSVPRERSSSNFAVDVLPIATSRRHSVDDDHAASHVKEEKTLPPVSKSRNSAVGSANKNVHLFHSINRPTTAPASAEEKLPGYLRPTRASIRNHVDPSKVPSPDKILHHITQKGHRRISYPKIQPKASPRKVDEEGETILPMHKKHVHVKLDAVSHSDTEKDDPGFWESATEQPYCPICKRAFKTVAQLKTHEDYSTLHSHHVKKLKFAQFDEYEDASGGGTGAAVMNDEDDDIYVPLMEDAVRRLIYSGTKYFSGSTPETRAALDLEMHFHEDSNAIEVIAYDGNRYREMDRLYLDYSEARKYLPEGDVHELALKVAQAARKMTCDKMDIETAARLCMTTFILTRLRLLLDDSRPYRYITFLPSGVEGKPDESHILLPYPPPGLFPVTVARFEIVPPHEVRRGLEQLAGQQKSNRLLIDKLEGLEKETETALDALAVIPSLEGFVNLAEELGKKTRTEELADRLKLYALNKGNLSIITGATPRSMTTTMTSRPSTERVSARGGVTPGGGFGSRRKSGGDDAGLVGLGTGIGRTFPPREAPSSSVGKQGTAVNAPTSSMVTSWEEAGLLTMTTSASTPAFSTIPSSSSSMIPVLAPVLSNPTTAQRKPSSGDLLRRSKTPPASMGSSAAFVPDFSTNIPTISTASLNGSLHGEPLTSLMTPTSGMRRKSQSTMNSARLSVSPTLFRQLSSLSVASVKKAEDRLRHVSKQLLAHENDNDEHENDNENGHENVSKKESRGAVSFFSEPTTATTKITDDASSAVNISASTTATASASATAINMQTEANAQRIHARTAAADGHYYRNSSNRDSHSSSGSSYERPRAASVSFADALLPQLGTSIDGIKCDENLKSASSITTTHSDTDSTSCGYRSATSIALAPIVKHHRPSL